MYFKSPKINQIVSRAAAGLCFCFLPINNCGQSWRRKKRRRHKEHKAKSPPFVYFVRICILCDQFGQAHRYNVVIIIFFSQAVALLCGVFGQ